MTGQHIPRPVLSTDPGSKKVTFRPSPGFLAGAFIKTNEKKKKYSITFYTNTWHLYVSVYAPWWKESYAGLEKDENEQIIIFWINSGVVKMFDAKETQI